MIGGAVLTAGCGSAASAPRSSAPTASSGPLVTISSSASAASRAEVEGEGEVEFGFSPGADLRVQDDAALGADLDAMAAVGAGWVRLDLDWSTIEREPGEFDWSESDRLIAAALERELSVLALVAYSPSWASAGERSSKAPPEDDRAFAEFAFRAASRYGPLGVEAWQIWNEPNSQLFWETGPDPERYGALLAASTVAIRSAQPDATIVSAGLAPGRDVPDEGWLSPETFLRRLIETGALVDVDAVAIHPYSFPALPLDPGSADWNTFLRLPDLHAMLVASDRAPDKLWITEYGAPTGSHLRSVSEAEQAAMVDEALRVTGERPWLGPIFLYALRDYRSDPEDLEWNYGVLNNDGSPKQAWHELLERRIDEAPPKDEPGSE